jgi:hypothetical protein
MENRDYLIEVRKNIFIAKNDPDFLRKYLKYYPEDGPTLYKYAKKLEKDGDIKQSLLYYKKASKMGSIESKSRLSQIEKNAISSTRQKNKKENIKPLNRIFIAILLLFLLLLYLLYIIVSNLFFAEENHTHLVIKNNDDTPPTHYIPIESSKTLETLKTHITLTTTEINPLKIYNNEELLYLIVLNAIVRYKEERGVFPSNVTKLIQNNPENWISLIPKNIVYRKAAGTGFSLTHNEINANIKNETLQDSSLLQPFLMELHFFPKNNTLALVIGNKNLAVYPVASGAESIPLTESKVLARIVEPNGASSSLGTRGLLLHDEFAIHGTNDPKSIGERVTEGCLRLFNTDIEILYPYISKGTPFKVMEGLPSKPMFEMGLPTLHNDSTTFQYETTPGKVYAWKN